jgi:[protein-PII] uridylyltransferase
VLQGGAMIATFAIQDQEGKNFEADAKRLKPLAELLDDAKHGRLDFAKELPLRRVLLAGREVAIEPGVFIDNHVSSAASVIEVNARDRMGLLYDILGAMMECQLQVMTAHIATFGRKAVDVFYVKDAFGIKIIHPKKLAQVQHALLTACAPREAI